jgi:hypothetical protein
MLVENKGTIIVRPVSQMSDDVEDEICLMQRAANAWGEIEKGNAKKMGKTDFLKELAAW